MPQSATADRRVTTPHEDIASATPREDITPATPHEDIAPATPREDLPPAQGVTHPLRHKLTLVVVTAMLTALLAGGLALVLYDPGLIGQLRDYWGIFGAVTALSLLVALAVSVWLQAVLTRPILATAAAAREAVERRDFSLRVPKATDDEIGSLADAFNEVLAEIGRSSRALETANRSLARETAERKRAEDERRRLNARLERRGAELAAQLEAATKELESLTYSVSHDLREPVRAVIGFSRMLDEDHGAQMEDEARRKLQVVRSEGRRIGTLIDDLLTLSRLERQSMQMTEVDMTGLARATYEGLTRHGASPQRELRLGALPRAQGDRALLGQVWANLLANAVKFSSKRERPLVEISTVADDNEHIYFVRDNGAGFDPRYRSKLFGVFQRLHSGDDYPGTGVGLALVQRIVARHGGRVWAEGQPEAGATFYFSLPKEQSRGPV